MESPKPNLTCILFLAALFVLASLLTYLQPAQAQGNPPAAQPVVTEELPRAITCPDAAGNPLVYTSYTRLEGTDLGQAAIKYEVTPGDIVTKTFGAKAAAYPMTDTSCHPASRKVLVVYSSPEDAGGLTRVHGYLKDGDQWNRVTLPFDGKSQSWTQTSSLKDGFGIVYAYYSGGFIAQRIDFLFIDQNGKASDPVTIFPQRNMQFISDLSCDGGTKCYAIAKFGDDELRMVRISVLMDDGVIPQVQSIEISDEISVGTGYYPLVSVNGKSIAVSFSEYVPTNGSVPGYTSTHLAIYDAASLMEVARTYVAPADVTDLIPGATGKSWLISGHEPGETGAVLFNTVLLSGPAISIDSIGRSGDPEHGSFMPDLAYPYRNGRIFTAFSRRSVVTWEEVSYVTPARFTLFLPMLQ